MQKFFYFFLEIFYHIEQYNYKILYIRTEQHICIIKDPLKFVGTLHLKALYIFCFILENAFFAK